MRFPKHNYKIRNTWFHLWQKPLLKVTNFLKDHIDIFVNEKINGLTGLVGKIHEILIQLENNPEECLSQNSNKTSRLSKRYLKRTSSKGSVVHGCPRYKVRCSSRFSDDYRKLSDITKKNSFPLPRTDDTLDVLSRSEWFSSKQ